MVSHARPSARQVALSLSAGKVRSRKHAACTRVATLLAYAQTSAAIPRLSRLSFESGSYLTSGTGVAWAARCRFCQRCGSGVRTCQGQAAALRPSSGRECSVAAIRTGASSLDRTAPGATSRGRSLSWRWDRTAQSARPATAPSRNADRLPGAVGRFCGASIALSPGRKCRPAHCRGS
jgi:hypothetical protein